MKPYIYIYKCNRTSRYFLCRKLKKKGYTFRNSMSKEHIFINPSGKYAFCMCNKVASDSYVLDWVFLNCRFLEAISFSIYVLIRREARFIQHVVYSHREGLRWYFKSTETGKLFVISLYLKDILLLSNGLYLLIPPLKKSHIYNL